MNVSQLVSLLPIVLDLSKRRQETCLSYEYNKKGNTMGLSVKDWSRRRGDIAATRDFLEGRLADWEEGTSDKEICVILLLDAMTYNAKPSTLIVERGTAFAQALSVLQVRDMPLHFDVILQLDGSELNTLALPPPLGTIVAFGTAALLSFCQVGTYPRGFVYDPFSDSVNLTISSDRGTVQHHTVTMGPVSSNAGIAIWGLDDD